MLCKLCRCIVVAIESLETEKSVSSIVETYVDLLNKRESVVMVVHSEVAFITSPLIERIESLEKDEIARKRCS